MAKGKVEKARGRSRLITDELYVGQKKYYESTYSKDETPPWEDAFDPKWLQAALRKIGPARGRRALEIGSGRGKGAWILERAGWRTVGIDYLYEPLALARSKGKRPPLFVHADAFSAPFREHAFDLLLDWGVFHHIRRCDTRLYLESVTGLLRPGGSFLLGCFSTRFKHTKNEVRKRNWTRHRGHYDRFSTLAELRGIFSRLFAFVSVTEDPRGFYLLRLARRRLSG